MDYGRALFSRSALHASSQTLLQQDGRPFGTAEGLWYMERYNERMQSEDEVANQFARQLKVGMCDAPQPRPDPIDPAMIDRTPMAGDKGMGLRNLIRAALANDVELVLLLNPTHVLFNEIFRQCGAGISDWQYRWWIASVVDQEARDHSRLVRFWDFYSYGPLTGERLHSGKPMRDRLWQDAGHFNHEVGAKVFDAIYGGAPDFGVEVDRSQFRPLRRCGRTSARGLSRPQSLGCVGHYRDRRTCQAPAAGSGTLMRLDSPNECLPRARLPACLSSAHARQAVLRYFRQTADGISTSRSNAATRRSPVHPGGTFDDCQANARPCVAAGRRLRHRSHGRTHRQGHPARLARGRALQPRPGNDLRGPDRRARPVRRRRVRARWRRPAPRRCPRRAAEPRTWRSHG